MTLSDKPFSAMQRRSPGGVRSSPGLRLTAVLSAMAGLFFLAGCATRPGPAPVAPAPRTVPTAPPTRVEPPPAPKPTPTPAPVVRAPEVKPADAPPRLEPEPPAPLGETHVLVESEPAGAMVVVNGVPIGRTPRKVLLPVSAQGFSRDTVSIKVRFVSETPGQPSQTVEEILTPLDRMPGSLVFTLSKVQRKQ